MSTLKFNVEADWQEVQKLRKECEELEKQLSTMDTDSDAGRNLIKQLENIKGRYEDLTKEAGAFRKETEKLLNESASKLESVSIGGVSLGTDASKQTKEIAEMSKEYQSVAENATDVEQRLSRVSEAMAKNSQLAEQSAEVYRQLKDLEKDYSLLGEVTAGGGDEDMAEEVAQQNRELQQQIEYWEGVNDRLKGNGELLTQCEANIRGQEQAVSENVEVHKENVEAIKEEVAALEEEKKQVETISESNNNAPRQAGKGERPALYNSSNSLLYFEYDDKDYNEYLRLLDEVKKKQEELQGMDMTSDAGRQLKEEYEGLYAQLKEVEEQALELGRNLQSSLMEATAASKETRGGLQGMKSEVQENIEDARAMTTQFTKTKATGEELKEQLESIAAALDKNKAAYEQNQQAIEKLKKAQKDLEKVRNVSNVSGNEKQAATARDQLKQVEAEISIRKDLGKQLDENSEQLNACKEQIDGYTESMGGSEQKMVSYQTQIRQMVLQLAQMEMAGKRGTAEYIELQNKLGELSATMSGARAQMKAFAQPYPGLAATTGLISDMSSAVKVGAGIWGMFSAETEEAQKILVKLQSVMSIANGLQEVANKLNKNNATSILLMSKGQERWNKLKSIFNKTQQAENAATAGNTAAQNANTLAKNANAASQQTKNAATATGTTETIGNTGAEVANTAAAEGLTIANFTLAGAFKAVGTAILGIPAIGWIVGAVAGLATLISYLTEYEREQRKVEKAGREAAAVTKSQMELLVAQWQQLDSDVARDSFIQNNQDKFNALGKEVHSTTDFLREFSEANIESAGEIAKYDKMIEEETKKYEEYAKDLSKVEDKVNRSKEVFNQYFAGRIDPNTGKEYQRAELREERNFNQSQALLAQYNAERQKLIDEQNERNINAQVENNREMEKLQFDQRQKEIDGMKDGYAKQFAQMKLNTDKEYDALAQEQEALEKKQGGKLYAVQEQQFQIRRNLLDSQWDIDLYNLKQHYAEQLETSLTSLVRAHATVLRYQQQLRNEEAQGEINLIKNQFDKQQKQEELNHKQNLDNIQKRHDEVYDQIVENARKEFEAREANNESEAIKNGGEYKRNEWLESDEYKNAKSKGEVEANKFVNTMLEQEEKRHNEAMKQLNIQLLEAEESNSRALQKIKADLVKIDEDLSNQRSQAEINAMKSGGLKSLKQATQNYEQQKAQLEANNKDYIQKIIDAKKQEFEAQEKENEINAKKNGTTYERQDWQTSQAHTDAIEEANKKGAEKLAADTVDINQSYNDEVRKIIEQDIGDLTTVNEKLKQTQENLKAAREALEQQHNSGEVSDEEYENGLANLDFEEIKQQLDELNEACGGSLMDYFSKFSSETQNTIKTLKSKLEAELKNLKSLEVVTPEQVGRMQKIEDELQKLRKSDKDIKKVSKAFGDMGKSVAGIGNSLDDLIGGMDDTGKAAFNLVETTLNSAQQLCDMVGQQMEQGTLKTVMNLKTMESACFILAVIEAIMQVISAFANMFSGKSSMELYEEEEAKAQQYMDTLDRVKNKRLEVADSAAATTKETIDAYQDAIDITETEIEAQRKLAKEYANARDKGSHTAGYTSYQNQTASSWQQAANALNMDVDSLKSMMGGRMEGLYDLSMDQIEALMKYAPEFLAELDSDMYDYLMTIYDLGDECKDLAEEMQEAIAGISFDDMYENFRDVLMNMDSDMNDFTNTINDMLKNSISQYVMSKDKDQWENWYEEYTKMVEDGNWDAADALVEEAKNIYAREREEMDNITSSISSLNESSQGDATTAAFQTMSEDTASELSARFLALFEVGSRIETATQDDMNTRSVEMADLTSIARLQVEQLIGLNSIADESRTFLADSFLELQSITENTEKIVENTKYIKQWTYDTKVNTSRL